MKICHFHKVDKLKIKASFSYNKQHRFRLEIPFIDRKTNKTLCVIGQNPSCANQHFADKTLHYIERFIYEKHPEYDRIVILNLFSRIDTHKSEANELLSIEAARLLRREIKENTDFLMIYGKLKNHKSYNFVKRAKQIKNLLDGKSVFKIDTGDKFAPHPGNPKLHYGNYCYDLTKYLFCDV